MAKIYSLAGLIRDELNDDNVDIGEWASKIRKKLSDAEKQELGDCKKKGGYIIHDDSSIARIIREKIRILKQEQEKESARLKGLLTLEESVDILRERGFYYVMTSDMIGLPYQIEINKEQESKAYIAKDDLEEAIKRKDFELVPYKTLRDKLGGNSELNKLLPRLGRIIQIPEPSPFQPGDIEKDGYFLRIRAKIVIDSLEKELEIDD